LDPARARPEIIRVLVAVVVRRAQRANLDEVEGVGNVVLRPEELVGGDGLARKVGSELGEPPERRGVRVGGEGLDKKREGLIFRDGLFGVVVVFLIYGY